jgi:hypothetical protein
MEFFKTMLFLVFSMLYVVRQYSFLFPPDCIFIQPGRKKKEHCLKKYNMEERRKSIVLKNTIWRKQERVLS